MKHKAKAALSLTLCLTVALTFLTVPTDAAVRYMPDVTKEMSKANYWIDKLAEPDTVLAEETDLEGINQMLCAKGAPMYDLANWSDESFNGIELAKALQRSAESDAKYLYDGCGVRYDSDGHRYATWEEALAQKFQPMIDNCVDPEATEEMPVQYAVCTTRTCLQGFPSEENLLDDPSDPDFDYRYHTMLHVNEPIVLKSKSADGRYYCAIASCTSGWVAAKDVAICQDKAEWLDAWLFAPDQTLVVCDDKIYTEDSNFAPETANRKLPMGTYLKLADESEWTGLISNRSAHNNHVVWMPVRAEDGTYYKQLALIGENRKVSEGYLPLTYSNILYVALNQLGDAYGWGGMMGTEDCSGYIRDVYRCFGLDMMRSAGSRDAKYLKYYDLTGMNSQEKTDAIRHLPPGAILSFSGHEMMYLGCENEKLYVISEVSSVMLDGNRARIRNCVISTLDIQRANGKTWLEELNFAELPYYTSAQADPAYPYNRLDNPMTAACKNVKVKYKKLKKSKQVIKPAQWCTLENAVGPVTFKKTKGSKKIKVSKSGTITIKKKTKKGSYKVRIQVKAAGNDYYDSRSTTVSIKIRVK